MFQRAVSSRTQKKSESRRWMVENVLRTTILTYSLLIVCSSLCFFFASSAYRFAPAHSFFSSARSTPFSAPFTCSANVISLPPGHITVNLSNLLLQNRRFRRVDSRCFVMIDTKYINLVYKNTNWITLSNLFTVWSTQSSHDHAWSVPELSEWAWFWVFIQL